MGSIIDICGTPIDITKITEYRIQQYDYIFRPVFVETSGSGIGRLWKRREVVYSHMEPYAVILGVNGRKTALAQFNPTNIGEAVVADIGNFFHDITEGIAGLLNVKTLKEPKYSCARGSNLEERFVTYLHDIPARLIEANGRPHDVYKHDEIYNQIIENIDPVRQLVSALTIKTANNRYVFFGAGVHLQNVENEYQRLHQMVVEGKEKKKQITGRPLLELPKIEKLIPQIKISFSSNERNDETASSKNNE